MLAAFTVTVNAQGQRREEAAAARQLESLASNANFPLPAAGHLPGDAPTGLTRPNQSAPSHHCSSPAHGCSVIEGSMYASSGFVRGCVADIYLTSPVHVMPRYPSASPH